MDFFTAYGEAAKTALGFFWKSGWAFVLGYSVSAMIQAFVPKKKLVEKMGTGDAKSISLSTFFGAISSSCSFAALATARSLFLKGASFVSTVAFMFASTNLVIELGILIFIFLGWKFLVAELIGGLVLIIISSALIKLLYPENWIENARKRLEEKSSEDLDFDWRKRFFSKKGWYRVGSKFVMEWKMAWEDILIGFTIAGFVSVLVPKEFWQALFLNDLQGSWPDWLIQVENAMVAPFVAAATFIGSMGNIPLATVLNEHGVLFAGIMGFIYSDLMVPPLLNMNRKYYGWRIALYIAGIMYISIVATALLLNTGFELLGLIPQGSRKVKEMTQFEIDYTFWLNIFFVLLASLLIYFNYKFKNAGDDSDEAEPLSFKRIVVYIFVGILAIGLGVYFFV